jgi:alginate O-acetyltransferase complex protein AlgI
MGFITYYFLIFFLVVFILYWILPRQRWQNLILLVSSAVFYGWLAPWHTAVLFTSIVVDYFLAIAMTRSKPKAKFLMLFGVTLNLGFLLFIKYYLVFNDTLAAWAGQLGHSGNILVDRIILPLGVSFYTLKKISYLIEVNKGTQQPAYDFVAFAAYISFFPQVLSGPIERPQKFLKQLEVSRKWVASHFYNAWQLVLMGLFKKLVVANTVKVFVDQIFLRKEPSQVFLIVGGIGFTLQILADFSSYTDISRGVSYMLGLETTENFNRPYLSYTPTEFWNRWHISLSSWLRDYIFFPLRRVFLRARNLSQNLSLTIPPLITMFVSGLWHGVGPTFVVWGLYYGVLIIAYQLLGMRGDWRPSSGLGRFVAWFFMFLIIVFGWIIFRAQSISWLWNIFFHSPFYRSNEELIASLVLMIMIVFYASLLLVKHVLDVHRLGSTNFHALYYAVVTLLIVVYINSTSPDFIYFQF